MKKVFNLLCTLLCLGMSCACTGSVEGNEKGVSPISEFVIDSSEEQDSIDISIEYVSLEELPDWIAQWASDVDMTVGSSVCFREIEDNYGSALYRGEWEGIVYYWIINPLSSCAFCDSFYEDGKRLDFGDDRVKQAFENAYQHRKRIYIK